MNRDGIPPSHVSAVVRAAAVLGLVWLGDALIYVVMPLHAAAFGISLGLVGVVLSANRIVRILGYGWLSAASRRFGMRALTASAAVGAAGSTIAYGVFLGFVPLLVARLVWGMAYAVLNVTTTAYAIGDGRRTGRRVGLNRAVSGIGPTLALSVGAWLTLGLGLFFANAAIDGAFAFTLSLLFAGALPLSSALLAAGLILAFQRLMVVLLSLVGGTLIDRVGAYRVLVPCVVLVVAGLFALAHGVLYPAALALVIMRALLSVTGPVLAARERSGSTVERLAAFATWVDSGLAVGPLLSGFFVARFGLPALYQTLAVGIALALVVHLGARRRAA